MEGKDSGKKPEDSQSSNLQVRGEDLIQLISYLQELQVKGASIQASSSGGFSLSPIAKARSGSQDLRKPGTKVLSENSVKYWTALGGPLKIRELRRETGVAATLCRTQGVVEAKDLVIGDKAVVLRNAGLRYQVKIEDFTTGNTLSTFSLIFTEFESEGFLFHTTWQWEVGTWQERASSVWDMLTLEMLD
jgi:hemin uptake protein HemP